MPLLAHHRGFLLLLTDLLVPLFLNLYFVKIYVNLTHLGIKVSPRCGKLVFYFFGIVDRHTPLRFGLKIDVNLAQLGLEAVPRGRGLILAFVRI